MDFNLNHAAHYLALRHELHFDTKVKSCGGKARRIGDHADCSTIALRRLLQVLDEIFVEAGQFGFCGQPDAIVS